MNMTVRPSRSALHGCVRVPGDKSITHRAILLAAMAEGTSRIEGHLESGDCQATLDCVRRLGIAVESECEGKRALRVHGRGLRGWREPAQPLDCVRSGTTMRLLTGALAGQEFDCTLTGDVQLLRRPMRRVVDPLRRLGASIEDVDGYAPLRIRGRALHGGTLDLAVPSAQVKSALLLAGLAAEGPVVIRQPSRSRDHTERMLSAMGAAIQVDSREVTVRPSPRLMPLSCRVPGDASSAAFLWVAGTLVPGSHIATVDVGVNPTRTGLLDALAAMGANLHVENRRMASGEPVADIRIRASALTALEVGGDRIVDMIDELPVLAVAATQARGVTTVRGAKELRVKETDRIETVVSELRTLGARIDALDDGFVIEGPTRLHGGRVRSHGDHRLAMALCVAALVADGCVVVEDTECVRDSYPTFFEQLRSVGGSYG